MNKVDYAIIAKSENDTIMLSKYRNKVCAVRQTQELVLSDILLAIEEVKSIKRADQYLIAPSTEGLNRFLLKYRSEFNDEIIVPLVEEPLYEIISDKYSFSELCRRMNLLVPSEYSSIEHAKTPFVAKPKKYFSDNGITYSPVLIYDDEDKKIFCDKHNADDFYYQEYVNGSSYYLLFYFCGNGDVIRYSQKNVAQQPQGKSIVAAVSSSIHKDKIADEYELFFNRLGYRGFVMIELRRMNSEYFMIEANPRFWGPSQLFVDAGVDLFSAFLYDYGVLEKMPVYRNSTDKIRYYWHGGVVSSGSRNIVIYDDDYTVDDFDDWICDDIYRRNDTTLIYESEM